MLAYNVLHRSKSFGMARLRHKKTGFREPVFLMAEKEGFEPSIRY